MTFEQYLKSTERRALYRNHPEVKRIGRLNERLKNVSHADSQNWQEKHGPQAS